MPTNPPNKDAAPKMNYTEVVKVLNVLLKKETALDEYVKLSVTRQRDVLAALITEVLERGILQHKENLTDDIKATFQALGTEMLQQWTAHKQDVNARLRAIEAASQITVTLNRVGESPTSITGLVHKQFPTLLKLIANGNPTILTGPTQSGKSKAVEQVADALGLKYYYHAFGPTQTETALAGFVSASGMYIYRSLYLAAKHGGIWCADEMDVVRDAGVLIWMNNGISNEVWSFPQGAMDNVLAGLEEAGDTDELDAAAAIATAGGQVRSHKDLRILATMNTTGAGSNLTYVGRGRIDPSTLARFDMLPWEYDEKLERQLALRAAPGGDTDKWVTFSQAVRQAVEEDNMASEIVVSPSHTLRGAKMLAAGLSWDEVTRYSLLTVRVDEGKRQQLISAANRIVRSKEAVAA